MEKVVDVSMNTAVQFSVGLYSELEMIENKTSKQNVKAVTHLISDVCAAAVCCIPSNEDAEQINVVRPCQQHCHTKSQFEHK